MRLLSDAKPSRDKPRLAKTLHLASFQGAFPRSNGSEMGRPPVHSDKYAIHGLERLNNVRSWMGTHVESTDAEVIRELSFIQAKVPMELKSPSVSTHKP